MVAIMKLEKTINKLKTCKSLKIVALGDSLTYGWMVDKGYLAFFEELISIRYPKSIIEIVNRGVPGDTAKGGLLRLAGHVISEKPDLVLVQFALNDAFTGHPVNQFKENISSIITGIKANTSAEILLVTSSALEGADKDIAGKYYSALSDIATDKGIPIALTHEYSEQKIARGTRFETLVQNDRVHPSEEGYRLMAEAIVSYGLSVV
jgi:acyl-CoA thioesterase-1